MSRKKEEKENMHGLFFPPFLALYGLTPRACARGKFHSLVEVSIVGVFKVYSHNVHMFPKCRLFGF